MRRRRSRARRRNRRGRARRRRNPLYRRGKGRRGGTYSRRRTSRRLKVAGRRGGWRNPRRRRGRRRRSYNRRRTYRRRRRNMGRRHSYNRRRRGRRRSHGRRRARNQGTGAAALRRWTTAPLAAYDAKVLTDVATVAAGALANNVVVRVAEKYIPGYPDMLKEGIPGILVRLGFAGVTGAGAARVLGPNVGWKVFYGGALQAMMDVFNTYVVPNVPFLQGLDDFLTVEDARRARPLGTYDDYELGMSGMNDFLTVEDARRARPLGQMPDEESELYVAEELAAIA